jgi:4-oxalocrotonate tautomerase
VGHRIRGHVLRCDGDVVQKRTPVHNRRATRAVVTPVSYSHGWQENQKESNEMPFVNVKVIEGVFSATQKQDIVRKVTDAMVEIEGETMRPVTWVVVEEVASGDWGIGGTPMHTADVKALAAGSVG